MLRKGLSGKERRIQKLFGVWRAQRLSVFRSSGICSLPKGKRDTQKTFTLSVPIPPRKGTDVENQRHPAVAHDGGARRIGPRLQSQEREDLLDHRSRSLQDRRNDLQLAAAVRAVLQSL